jgi:tetratricopeptide (TPR) repeat protein
MNATPREHYEEIDWLDFVQGSADRSQAGEMHHHLARCEACRGRLDSMRRLADAIPFAERLVDAATDLPRDDRSSPRVESILRKARASADAVAPDREASRAEVLAFFSQPGRGEFHWTSASFESARALSRELLRSDVPLAGRIVRSGLSALESAPNREEIAADGLEGALRTALAYVLYEEGESERSLAELERARPILEARSRVPEDDLAFWSYVSALALRDLGRAQAALEALDVAEHLGGLLQDFPRQARCRIVRAVILSDLGKPEKAVSIYEDLLARGEELEDPRVLSRVYLNLGRDLVRINRLNEAKRIYARTAKLFLKNGQDSLLVRLRAGLAEIAAREGRFQDSYDIGIQLRENFRSQNLGWDEVQTELRIVEALLNLGRGAEAAETCRKLLPRIEELGLSIEAARALEYLIQAELSSERVVEVKRFLDRLERGEDLRWSAA